VAEIRLVNATKTFRPGMKFLPTRGARGLFRDYEDKAFVERVAGQEVATGQTGGSTAALDHLDLTVLDGQAVAIVGPSGCGKSTLLRVVAGLEPLDEGQVLYDGQDMEGVPPKDRGIGMVFQSYALYPHMKGEGNLGFFFRVRKRPPEEMMERIRITSEMMGIGFEVLLDRKPGTLSGGQQQRVAIARCLVRDPSLFLFDEPLSNLDAKLRSSTRIEIKRLLQRFHITAIYVTHDQTEAITLGDRIAVMRDGRIEQIGTYQEITTDPINDFVAGFLGLPPMNLLRGWQVENGELMREMGRMALPTALRSAVSQGDTLTIGFRSDDASLVAQDESDSASDIGLAAEILNSEPNFARHYQTVNVQANDVIFSVQADLEFRATTGRPVYVVIPKDSMYLFGETGERIRIPE